MLSPFYYSLEEAYEVMGRYYWWPKSNMNIERLRFGVLDRWRNHPHNKTTQYCTQTWINPVVKLGKFPDMNIWERSFLREHTEFSIEFKDYDDVNKFPKMTITNGWTNEQYVAISPKSRKWSNVNTNRKIPFVCEVPRFPKLFCEKGWWLHMKSRSCYHLYNATLLSFTDASLKCQSLKSTLASVNEETENKMILQMGVDYEIEKTWFGLRHDALKTHANAPKDRKSAAFFKYYADNFYFLDGTPINGTFHFFSEEQDQSVKSNCFFYTRHFWHEAPCNTKAWTLCRKMASNQPYRT
uniref:C-type lectin domain-containing protein n=1 Tax=Panagrolaimus sp. PS1159 TaxID=55785 RepID=A0AC35FZG9_9BILA